jgi:hypothetical protein
MGGRTLRFSATEMPMPTIHVPGDGHVTPIPLADGTTWAEYSDAKIKKTLERALFILKHNIRGMKPCNTCFSALPGGRTFDQVIDDASIFISFDPSGPNSGVTNAVGGKEVTISASEFRGGRWTVAATLVHELAHVNGAGTTTLDAENTLKCCGLFGLFRAGSIGMQDIEDDDGPRYA